MLINKIKRVTYPIQYVLMAIVGIHHFFFPHQFYPAIVYVAYIMFAFCILNAILVLGVPMYKWMQDKDNK